MGVEDADGYFTGDDVEEVLAEIGAVLDDNTDGNLVKRVLRVTFDPSTNASERTVAAHSSTVTLPDNAIVTRAWYEVLTTFTSAADTATISIGIDTDDAGGIVVAVAINDGSNPWDAGYHEGIQDGAAANFSTKTTAADRTIDFTVAVQALTAGKLVLFLEYVVSD